MLRLRQLSLNTYVWQSAVLAETREGQVRVGADVPSVREKTSCFLWVIQQSKVVGCCPAWSPGSHRQEMFCCNPVDMLAVEVINVQSGVWERGDGH